MVMPRIASGQGHTSWQELLGPAAPGSHVVQLYDSDAFLANAVSYFAAEGLQRGEAVLLTGTKAHLDGIRRDLRMRGVDTGACARSGQLRETDVETFAAAAMSGEALQRAALDAVLGAALAGVRADPRFKVVRWWGETSAVVYQRAGVEVALSAETSGDEMAKEHGLTLFCSYHCDRFDPRGYDGVLRDICCKHSHLIPAEDYARHRVIVNRAIDEVLGGLTGSLLQSLASWRGLHCDQPSSQAILFWLRDTMPDQFEAVLSRARAYHMEHDPRASA